MAIIGEQGSEPVRRCTGQHKVVAELELERLGTVAGAVVHNAALAQNAAPMDRALVFQKPSSTLPYDTTMPT